MKIKDVLQALIHNVEDHHWESVDKLAHGDECEACRAVRAAEHIMSVNLIDFEAGDKVLIEGDIRGRVIGMDTTVRVELHGERGHGPYAVGTFSPHVLKPITPDEYFSDCDGDVWKVVGEKTLTLFEIDGEPIPEKALKNCAQAEVEQIYGPLKSVKR